MVCVNAALLYARFHFHFYSTATVLQMSFIRKGYERVYYYYSLKRAHTRQSLPECGSVLCTVQPRYTDPEEIIELRLEKKKNLLFFATPNVLVFFLTTRPNLIRPWGNGQLIQFHPSLLLPFCQVHLYESIKNDKKEWKKRKERKKEKNTLSYFVSFLIEQGCLLFSGHVETPFQHHPLWGLDVLERLGSQRHLQSRQVHREECTGRHIHTSGKGIVHRYDVVTQFCTIFEAPPSIVTRFIT